MKVKKKKRKKKKDLTNLLHNDLKIQTLKYLKSKGLSYINLSHTHTTFTSYESSSVARIAIQSKRTSHSTYGKGKGGRIVKVLILLFPYGLKADLVPHFILGREELISVLA